MDLSITALGAKPGDEISAMLQTAIDTVGQAGGGRVFIPATNAPWVLDNANSVYLRWSNVIVEGGGGGSRLASGGVWRTRGSGLQTRATVPSVSATTIKVINWQPFIPPQDGTADQHAGIIVGSQVRDVTDWGIRRLRFVSEWDVDHHAPFGPQGDPKSLILLGYPLGGFYCRRGVLEDVTTDKCGSYLAVVLGNHDGLEIARCTATNQYFSGIACAGATFLQVPRVIDCVGSRIKALGIQWTGPVSIKNYRGFDCRSGGIMVMNSDDNALWSLIEGGQLERCGNFPSDTVAGVSILVGGEVYGGRRVRVSGVTVIDSYGSAIGWGGGQLKEIIVEDCVIDGVGLGCGTDDPSRAGIGKASGIQPIAGISLGGYAILVRRNSIHAEHTGFTAGKVAVRNGIYLLATEADGSTVRSTMLQYADCAYSDKVEGKYGDARLNLPSNASDQ